MSTVVKAPLDSTALALELAKSNAIRWIFKIKQGSFLMDQATLLSCCGGVSPVELDRADF